MRPPHPPLVSVVVPTHDRPVRLEHLLASLRCQTLGPDAFEVIVVDDGSGTDTQAALARAGSQTGLRLRTVRQATSRGPAAGRNRGWAMASAALVAFIDDDCVALPGWLEAGLRASRDAPGAIIQGQTQPDPRELGQRGLLAHTVAVDSLGPQYQACNIFYPRALLETLGGFDEAYDRRSAGEDTDLAWRAIELGHRTVFAPDALVHHAVE